MFGYQYDPQRLQGPARQNQPLPMRMDGSRPKRSASHRPMAKRRRKSPKQASKEEKKTEIIELLDVSSDEEDEEPILNTAGRVSWQNDPDSSESEFELE